MKKHFFFFIGFVSLFSYFSCSSDSTNAARVFQSAESVVEQFPDSALVLLGAIHNPYELNEKQHAEYILRSVQAKDKAYKDIASDTLIFKARDYFKRKKDFRNLALSELYCGRVLQSQKHIDEATKHYLEAKQLAEKINDLHLSGLIKIFIGEINYNQYLYDEAISYYQSALSDFSNDKKAYKKQISVCAGIGNSFLLKESPDSAFLYYQKGLELAILNNDSVSQSTIRLNMGVAFLHIGKIDSAKNMTKDALSISSEANTRAKIYLNLAKIYIQDNKKDSALYYSNLALNLSENDDSFKISIYRLLSKIEESKGNYQKSLAYYQQCTQHLISVFDTKEDVHVLEIQRKYDFELLQSANKKLLIERLWITIISIIAIGAVSFLFYRNYTQNKSALLIAKQQIYQINEMLNRKRETENNSSNKSNMSINNLLRDALFQQIEFFKKISLVQEQLTDVDKGNGRIILERMSKIMNNSKNAFDRKIFRQIVNVIYDNYLFRLQELYPQLSDDDILICCLSKIGFNNKEIGLLIDSNQNIVQKKKSSIREKISMEKNENFICQLDEIVKKHRDSKKMDNNFQ